MQKKWIHYSLIACFSSSSYAWTLEPTDESSIVKVWTQAVEGSTFRAFKGQVIIKTPMKEVFSVIKDTDNIPSWYHNTKKAKKLKQISDTQALSYAVTSAPWPVSDRDSVTLSTQKTLENGDYLIELVSKPDTYPKQPGLVRIPKLKGYWKLQATSKDLTTVTFEIAAEPGGEIPSWLANSMVVDMPFYTLSNLKMKLENP